MNRSWLIVVLALALVCALLACNGPSLPSAPAVTSTPPLPPGPPMPTGVVPSPMPTPTAWPDDPTRWQTFPSLNDVRGLAFAPDGALWAATSHGLAHFDGEAWHLDAASGGATINAFSFVPDGSLWLGTSKGAVRFYP
jgi:hypothetical protein